MLNIVTFLSINLVVVTSVSFIPLSLSPVIQRKCQPQLINVQQCRNKYYKYTDLPNLMGQDQESDIQSQMDTFTPLINQKCSNELNFLLCSVFTPICDPIAEILLGPCAGICEKVKSECEHVLRLFNLPWPIGLNCSRFPVKSTPKRMCMSNPLLDGLTTKAAGMRKLARNGVDRIKKEIEYNGKCRHLRHSEKYVYINRTDRCALKCGENDLFSVETKRFAEIWMSVLAVLTFFSTLFTCLTCCHSHKIRYPEQAITFLTLSYNLYSVSLLLRLFFTRHTVSCDFDPVSGQQILIQEGLENTRCAITFLLNFFFSTATHVWWVTLTGCWMAYSVFKISVADFSNNAGYLHLFVWLTTSMLTVSVLVLRCVEADELLGICSVGGQSPDLLMTFSIVPKTICLILGIFFLCMGFGFMKRRTSAVKLNSKKEFPRAISKMTSIAFRIGLFSGIYIVAISLLIACEFYQYFNYNAWKWAPKIFRNVTQPFVAIFLLNTFMSQVVGINSAIWIWSLDAATAWKTLYFTLRLKCKTVQPEKSLTQKYLVEQNVFKSSPNQHCQY